MTPYVVTALICGGSVVVVVGDQLGDLWLVGVGCLVALAGVALGVASRPGPAAEKVRGFADEFDRDLPSGGTGRVPTPRSAAIGVAYATVTALCWIALFMLGGKVGGSPAETALAAGGTLLLFGGWLERLSRIWGLRWTAAWVAALPLSLTLVVVHEWVAGGAFFAVVMYGVWTWPGMHGWERRPRRRRPRKSRPGRRARRRARERAR